MCIYLAFSWALGRSLALPEPTASESQHHHGEEAAPSRRGSRHTRQSGPHRREGREVASNSSARGAAALRRDHGAAGCRSPLLPRSMI